MDGNSSEASVDLYNFQIFPPCAHGSGGRQYFAEFLSKATNIFVDIRFQELACLNFLFGLFFFEKIKIRRTKQKLYSEFEMKKKSIKLKIIPRYLHETAHPLTWSTKIQIWFFAFREKNAVSSSVISKVFSIIFETKTEFPV